ncbi:DNA phosphorothioation-associated putative methyltransferase [Endozoicomonas atrinae]|uniref:DNA phosphorothioation-associated putative methyltransferase n=1 Tax=Endozoicomonas atrinae TaxID=1333660 RepID=UPI000824B678|nr:DNA phosphorothioation-associated putative methyltransferase [Endozoicomonas atrinae]
MNHEQWLSSIQDLRVGKVLPKAIYIHRDALGEISPALTAFIGSQALIAGLEDDDWNIARLHKEAFKVTLLYYPRFFDDAYPALHKSTGIDLAKEQVKSTDFTKSPNPPILHRKENMVLPSHPDYEDFCQITREGEEAGLYKNTKIIGFKHGWEALIHDKGYELVDGRLFRKASIDINDKRNYKVDRHKTALSRDGFSVPMKSLAKYGFLNGEFSVFDYGCGHGDDLAELSAHGILSSGWDPNWRPEGVKKESDLVNLGYVINVIENLQERVDALQGAWSLARKLLVVSAMVASERHISKFKPFKDGVLTSRNTFQKYYSQNELQLFLEQVLDDEPIPVAPGIFFIFKDKDQEQLYLSRKQMRRTSWRQLVHKTVHIPKRKQFLEKNRVLLDNLWQRILELGRVPAADEFSESEELKEVIGSPKKAFNFLREEFDTNALMDAEKARKEDLLVYFALQAFNKKRVYKHMPDQLKRDIKVFFTDYKNAQEEARTLLFSIAQPDMIFEACVKAHAKLPASYYDENHSLTLHTKYINDLPPALRVYIGCAAQLFSEADGFDLVKIHIRSGKISFMLYEDFHNSPLPVLKERIKINLRTRKVDYFDYAYGGFEVQPLYWKSQLIDDSFPDYNKQKGFDDRLEKLELPGMDGYGLSLSDLNEVLKHGYELKVQGYRFFKVS